VLRFARRSRKSQASLQEENFGIGGKRFVKPSRVSSDWDQAYNHLDLACQPLLIRTA